MHTSGYLGDRLNTYTWLPDRTLNPEVYEHYEAFARQDDQNIFRTLQQTALGFVLESKDKGDNPVERYGYHVLFDNSWGGALSIDRLEHRIFGDDTEVTLRVMGIAKGLGGLCTCRISKVYMLKSDSVRVDDSFELFPYEAAGLCIDLQAAMHTPALGAIMRENNKDAR